MKLKQLSKQITQLARDNVGGFGMYLLIGVRYSTLDADKDRDTRNHNLEAFADHDDTDLFDTRDQWRKLDIGADAELDFYVYDRYELKDNLGILVRDGKIVAYKVVGDRDLWRDVETGVRYPKSQWPRSAS